MKSQTTRRRPRARATLVAVLITLMCSGAFAQAQDSGKGPSERGSDKTPAAAAAKPSKAEPIQGEVSLSQRFSIEGAEADPEKIATVGSRLELRLEVTHPAETVVALPQEQKTGRFELIEVIREPIKAGENPIKETITMVYAVYRPGRHKLLPFKLSVMDSEGRISTVETEALELRVHSLLADLKDVEMPGMKAPVSVLKEDWTLV